MKIIDLEQGSQEWLDWRMNGIGASEMGAIMGVCPYNSITDIYLKKIGEKKDVYNQAMKHGNEQEPLARAWMENNFEVDLHRLCAEDEQNEHLKVSYDAINIEEGFMAEIKCPSSEKRLTMMIEGDIPFSYIYQVQWQMMVAKFKSAFLVVWDGHVGHCTLIQADHELWDQMKESALSFWNCVQTRTPPFDSKSHEDISNNHQDLLEIVQARRDAWELRSNVDKVIKECDEKIDALACGKNIIIHGLKLTMSKPRISYDIDKMKKDGIDLDPYKKIGKSHYTRTFIKEKED